MRPLLIDLYNAAVAAAAPGAALAARLAQVPVSPSTDIWIVALGKAALPMAHAAVEHLRQRGRVPIGGVVVAPSEAPPPHPSLVATTGDHPEPGPRSFAAAEILAQTVRRVRPSDDVWVLLSGGSSSPLAAPVDSISPSDLTSIYRLLLGSGLDIGAMNLIRKRFSRWGAGRLAAALAPARIHGFIVSDVIGDDLAAIGSGPCVADPSTAADVRRLLEGARLWDRMPASARGLLTAVEGDTTTETPKPGDQAFARVTLELIASNRLAVEAAAKRAAELGLAPVVEPAPLAGEAAAAGASVAARLLQDCRPGGFAQPDGPRRCRIWGGETTVTLGEDAPGLGGRCQELALAAAQVLDGALVPVALLAAGTDGRDGPTDAAGAMVDAGTWRGIADAGRDPAHDLARHDAYHALDAADALLRPGLTGTNVMDVVIGVC